MSSSHELAQLNIASMRMPLDSPEMADFVANLARINALADAAPGFIWRLEGDGGDATGFRPFGDDTLVNMSVWRDVESLNQYVYRTAHVEIMRRRKEWFERMREAYMVLWWVPRGHRPTAQEAMERLETLRSIGPSEAAFTFKQAFAAPGSGGDQSAVEFARRQRLPRDLNSGSEAARSAMHPCPADRPFDAPP